MSDLELNPYAQYLQVHELKARIAELGAENDRYRNGYKGGCWTCESVGELNVKLEAENQRLRDALEKGEASDGYHTHNELYEFRKLYNAALFNTWASSGEYSVHKSRRHHDGSLCFGGSWFIVVAMLPTGQISNHYRIEDWNLFQITEADSARFEYDGHTGADVINRLKALLGGGENG